MDTEYSVKLRLEKLSKSKLFLTVSGFLFVFVACVLIALLLTPSIIKSHTVNIYKCDKDKNINCYLNTTHEVWEGKIPNVSRLNQLLYMTATPVSANDLEFNMTMEILVMHKLVIIADNIKKGSISCKKGVCNTIVIFYLPYLEYNDYEVIIRHKSRILADSVEINLSYIESVYSLYPLFTKYGFFGLSVVAFIQFLVFSLKIPFSLWSFEAKLLLGLGGSLIVFNEPLLFVTIFFMNPLWSAVSVFCNTQFLAFILIFWLLDLQHYRKSVYNICYIIIGVLLVSILFGLVFTGYLYIHEKLRYDPTYDWQHDLDNEYKEIFFGILLSALVIICWILFLSCRALSQINQLSNRERMMKEFDILMIGFGFVGIAIGAFQPIPKYSSLLLIFESGVNLYVILLQLLFSPTSDSIVEYQKEKEIEYILVKSLEDDSEIELSIQGKS